MTRRQASGRRGAGRERAAWRTLAAAAAATTLVLALVGSGILAGPEIRFQDWALEARDRLADTAPAPPRVLVVGVDERDLRRLGHPVPDQVLATAISRALAGGARAVGVDLYRDLATPLGREVLTELVEQHPDVVFVDRLMPVEEKLRGPTPSFVRRPSQRGFGDFVRDEDGRVRRLLLLAWEHDGEVRSSLALRVAQAWLGGGATGAALEPIGEPGDPRHPLRLGRGWISRLVSGEGGWGRFDDGGYQIRADFRHGHRAFDRVSLSALLAGAAGPALLTDRAVLIGSVAPTVTDQFRDPTDHGVPRSGVELHALAVDQLLRVAEGEAGAPRPLRPAAAVAWIALAALLGSLVAPWLYSPLRVATAAAGLVLGGFAIALGGVWLGWWIPAAACSLAAGSACALALGEWLRRERRERALIDQLLGSAVSHPVREELWRNRFTLLEEGRLRARHATVTILFADLVAYAEVAETTPPALLLDWLADLMAHLAAEVETHGGIVDDYWGDGLKASFGALRAHNGYEDVARDAAAAVRCALAFEGVLAEVAARWRRHGIAIPRMKIGLHTGPAVVGSLGGLHRHKLTTVGDSVNVASRLETLPLAEAWQPLPDEPAAPRLRILASEDTLSCLGGAFRSVPLGEHVLRGRTARVYVHRIVGPANLEPVVETAPAAVAMATGRMR